MKELSSFFDRLYVVSQLISENKSNRQQFGFAYSARKSQKNFFIAGIFSTSVKLVFLEKRLYEYTQI